MRLAFPALVLLLCGCTVTPVPTDPRDAPLAGLAGVWDNRQQFAAASGRRMGINARLALIADGTLEYQESGVLDNGRYAFRVPPTEPYRFRRLR